MSDETTLPARSTEEAFENLLKTQYEVQQKLNKAIAEGNSFAFQLAKLTGIGALRAAFDEAVMPAIMSIAGTSIGFKTDQDDKMKGGTTYAPHMVRDCAIEATLAGLELMGNQFNILQEKMYITNEGYTYLLEHRPNLSDVDIFVGNPEDCEIQEEVKAGKNGTYTVFTVYGFVPVVIRYRVDGVVMTQENIKTGTLDGRFLVSASGKDKLKTVDSLKTKGERRARERLYEFVRTVRTDIPDQQPNTIVTAPSAATVTDKGDPTKAKQATQQAAATTQTTVDDTQPAASALEKAFLDVWRKELTVSNSMTNAEQCTAAAKGLFDIYNRGLTSDQMNQLDAYMNDMGSAVIDQRYKDKLKRFANAIIDQWNAVVAAS
jgi:hypothetical protein